MTARSEKHECFYRRKHLTKNIYECQIHEACSLTDCSYGSNYKLLSCEIEQDPPKICATIITSQREKNTIKRCQRFLKAAGIKEIITSHTTIGPGAGWLIAALKSYMTFQHDYHLIIQDDIFLSNESLTYFKPWLDKDNIISLFAPEALQDNKIGIKESESYSGGPNALILHKNVIEMMLTNRHLLQSINDSTERKIPYGDLHIFNIIKNTPIKILYHTPNLSIHWHKSSTHNPKQNESNVLAREAAGTYHCEMPKSYHIKSPANSLDPKLLISLYHEEGDIRHHFSTGYKRDQYHYDENIYTIDINLGLIDECHTDRIFWNI